MGWDEVRLEGSGAERKSRTRLPRISGHVTLLSMRVQRLQILIHYLHRDCPTSSCCCSIVKIVLYSAGTLCKSKNSSGPKSQQSPYSSSLKTSLGSNAPPTLAVHRECRLLWLIPAPPQSSHAISFARNDENVTQQQAASPQAQDQNLENIKSLCPSSPTMLPQTGHAPQWRRCIWQRARRQSERDGPFERTRTRLVELRETALH